MKLFYKTFIITAIFITQCKASKVVIELTNSKEKKQYPSLIFELKNPSQITGRDIYKAFNHKFNGHYAINFVLIDMEEAKLIQNNNEPLEYIPKKLYFLPKNGYQLTPKKPESPDSIERFIFDANKLNLPIRRAALEAKLKRLDPDGAELYIAQLVLLPDFMKIATLETHLRDLIRK
jgi:hypothetical protein